MVARLLIILAAMLLTMTGTQPVSARQLCLNCHPAHYAERGLCTACHRGNPLSERKNIAHQQLIAGRFARFTLGDVPETREGVRLIGQYACRRCHVIAGQGNRLSANLDASVTRRMPRELEQAILRPVQNMPDFRMAGAGSTNIVNALLAAGANSLPKGSDRPQVVHFNRSASVGEDIFSKRCGACHRILSERLGATGQGGTGPNLSGLLSAFYPKTFRNGEPWSVSHLSTWVKNPRGIRSWALMQPVSITTSEMGELVMILSSRSEIVSPDINH